MSVVKRNARRRIKVSRIRVEYGTGSTHSTSIFFYQLGTYQKQIWTLFIINNNFKRTTHAIARYLFWCTITESKTRKGFRYRTSDPINQASIQVWAMRASYWFTHDSLPKMWPVTCYFKCKRWSEVTWSAIDKKPWWMCNISQNFKCSRLCVTYWFIISILAEFTISLRNLTFGIRANISTFQLELTLIHSIHHSD